MSSWARFLTSGLEGVISLLDGLGARGTRWEWKKRAWRQALEARLASWENLGRGVRVRMRMCRACRTLVEGNARACPACGASMWGIPGGGLGRLLRLAVPAIGSMSVVLLTANVFMSLLEMAAAGASPGGPTGLLMSMPGEILYLLGAKWGPAITGGAVWRLVTANYLHGGLLHLAVNCYTLMNLGPLVEESFGWRKLFLIYTTTGIAAFTVSTLVHPRSLSVGASGALFGLLAFAVVFGRYRAGSAGRALAQHLLRWLMFGLVMFLIPRIDNAAHFGGAACGAVLALIVDPGEPRTPAGDRWLWLLTAVAIAVTIGSFAAMALSYRASLAALAGSA
jgi:rhomboid protease GluP